MIIMLLWYCGENLSMKGVDLEQNVDDMEWLHHFYRKVKTLSRIIICFISQVAVCLTVEIVHAISFF